MPRGGRGRLVVYKRARGAIVARAKLNYPRLSTAAAWAYNNREALSAGTKIARWGYKRYRGARAKRRKIMRSVGDANSAPPANRTAMHEQDTNKNSRELHAFNISGITRHTSASTTTLPGARVSNVIQISGFKWCIEIKNTTEQPLYFHYAIVVPKRPAEFALNANTKFFRAQDGITREQDFGNSLTALELHCLPINPNRFTILMHKKRTIAGAQTVGQYNKESPRNYMELTGYQKLYGRKYTFNTDNNLSEQPPVYFVYWCDRWGQGAASTPSSSISVQQRFLTYWRDVLGA